MAWNDAACGAETDETNEQLLSRMGSRRLRLRDREPGCFDDLFVCSSPPAFARLPRRVSLALLAAGALAATALFALRTSTAAALSGSATTQMAAVSVNGSAGCPVSGKSCMAEMCCADPGDRCYKKNKKWASCLKSCTRGKILKGDPDPTPWDCEDLAAPTQRHLPAPAPTQRHLPAPITAPSSNYCPVSGENCTALKCCAEPDHQCYKKNKKWASCLNNCTKGKKLKGDPNPTPWDCEELGPRNMPAGAPIVNVNYDYCASRGDDCRSVACCSGMGDNCYLKNPEWGSCQPECDPAARLTKGWSCMKLY